MSEKKPLKRSEDADPRQELKEIKSAIRRILDIRVQDLEDLAHDIWIECYCQDIRPTILRIRSRCYDWLRTRRVRSEEVLSEDPEYHPKELHDNGTIDYKAKVEVLMGCSDLSCCERKLIWLVYYKNLSLTTVAQEEKMELEQVQLRLSNIIFKLQQTAKLQKENI